MIMPVLIAIDPGYAAKGEGCAVARFVHGALERVFFARPESVDFADLKGAHLVIWECPQVDARTRTSTPAVVQLAAVGGTLAGMFSGVSTCRCTPVSPLEWKGSVPKPIAHARLWRALTQAERAVLGGNATAMAIARAQEKGALGRWGKPGAAYYPASFTTHNLLDAVGLGFWWLTKGGAR